MNQRITSLGSVLWVCLFVSFSAAMARGDDPPAATPPAATPAENAAEPDRETLFKQFEEKLSGSVLVGSFTTIGQEGNAPLSEDRYVLEKVKPLKNDYWLFEARIQYGGRDVKMPLTLQVKWAGDTPVITLTKILIPGMGTFTARILFYGDEYAGTWSAGDHGGHMFGRIEKLNAEPPKEEPAGETEQKEDEKEEK